MFTTHTNSDWQVVWIEEIKDCGKDDDQEKNILGGEEKERKEGDWIGDEEKWNWSSHNNQLSFSDVPINMIQDLTRPRVTVGFDVELMYPNLD